MSVNKKSLLELVAGKHHIERIDSLVSQPQEYRDIEWLELALQSAVSVEFSTIPPYLFALWSIKDETDEVAESIRNVVHEEMLHMSLACNMLTALGCIPQISNPNMVPRYPGPIPGHVHPELTVVLSGLSNKALDLFIAIEAPSDEEPALCSESQRGFKSIGEFYDAILDTFKKLNPKLATDRQITGPLACMVMEDLNSVESAINIIKDQGEGSEVSPIVEHTHELAHYYRFLEVRKGRRFSGVDENNQAMFDGPILARPDSWPAVVVPSGGYQQQDVPADVWQLINSADQLFTQMLDRLQVVWENGDQGALVHAIDTMFELSTCARSLMSMEIIGEQGNYGPCFRYLGESRNF